MCVRACLLLVALGFEAAGVVLTVPPDARTLAHALGTIGTCSRAGLPLCISDIRYPGWLLGGVAAVLGLLAAAAPILTGQPARLSLAARHAAWG